MLVTVRALRGIGCAAAIYWGLACSAAPPVVASGSPQKSALAIAPALSAVPAPTSGATFVVDYREAASIFETLDNVSNWLPDKCDHEYRDEWERRFPISVTDQAAFDAYKIIRKRYYPKPTDTTASLWKASIFGPQKDPDIIAEAFYGSKTVSEALGKLTDRVAAGDVASLARFFETFQTSTDKLLEEGRAFPEIAKAMQEHLARSGAGDFYRKVQAFYGLDIQERFTLVYVWWPPVAHVRANNRGGYLVMKYGLPTYREAASSDVDVAVHELVHFTSSRLSQARKAALTRAFVEAGGKLPEGQWGIEEPMAVAQQKYFLMLTDPKRLEFTSQWYGDRWSSLFAKHLYPHVKAAYDAGRPLDEAFMKEVAQDGQAANSELADASLK